MFFLSLELMGLVCPMAVPEMNSPMGIVLMVTYQILTILSGVFAARSIVFSGTLGIPPKPSPETPQAEQVAAVQEKV